MQDDPPGDLLRAERWQGMIAERPLQNHQWDTGLARGLVNAAKHSAKIIA